MPKYRVRISWECELEADNEEEAESEAIEFFEEDLASAISCGDNPVDWMSVRTERI
ncbi:MAG: hypothetical protein ACTSPB_20200 [Candidatus Thorarchaeota archaeon]